MKVLVLACGNPLRGDDGAGLVLARHAEEWAAERGRAVKVQTQMQWTPELAEEIAAAHAVVFLDCAVDLAPGEICVREVGAAGDLRPATHHLDAAELLALARGLYGREPRRAVALTIGAAHLGMGEGLSVEVEAALPEARALLEQTLKDCLKD